MNIEEKAGQIVAAAQIITVASIDENGYPRPVAMVKLKVEDGAIYVSTGASSAKTAHFKANPKAGISIVHGGDSIVYTGRMEIVADEAVKRSLWGTGCLSISPVVWKILSIACLNLRRKQRRTGLIMCL